MRRRLLVLPVLVLAVGGALALVERRGGGPAEPAPAGDGHAPPPRPGNRDAPHHHQPVHVRTVPRFERIPAKASGGEPVPVFSDLRAPFVEIPVSPGQAVKKGDLLLRADAAGVKTSLAAAEKRGDAKEVERLKTALAKAEVRAPVDGVVHSVEVSLGDLPPPPAPSGPRPVVVLYDWRTLTLRGVVPAPLVGLAAAGAEAWCATGGVFPVPGRIEEAGRVEGDGSVPVIVRPAEPPEAAPEPGAESEILLPAGTRDCLAVPMAALVQEEGRTVVFEVGITGELTPRPVGVGVRFPDRFIEITGVDRGISVAVWEAPERPGRR